MHEEMITLYHLRDWYGNVKQKRNIRQQSAIQQSVSQEATDAQCRNQGSPQPPRDHRVQPQGHHAHRFMDTIQKPAGCCLVASDKKTLKGETWCESGAKVKRQKLTALRASQSLTCALSVIRLE